MIDPLFDSLSDGLCVSDAEGGLVYMNPAAERLLDVSIAMAKGKTLCELLCGRLASNGKLECATGCALRDPAATSTAVTFTGRYGPKSSFEWHDFHVQRRDLWRDLRVRCLRTGSPGGPQHVTLIEDASAETALERQRSDWRHMIAHDLRSPLTNVFGVLRLLQLWAQGESARPEAPLIDSSVRSCRRILDLLDLYLDVAKLEAGLTEVVLRPFALKPVVLEAVDGQSALSKERGGAIEVDVPEGLSVLADGVLLGRVCENLINNAVKYGRKSGKVRVSARKGDSGQVELSVKDDGPGISEEELPHLFDRYHQAKARQDGKTPGTGLGLAFCREALRRMGGSISVKTRLGEGSEFQAALPAAEEKN